MKKSLASLKGGGKSPELLHYIKKKFLGNRKSEDKEKNFFNKNTVLFISSIM
jgi:hypothetical protein